MNEKVRFFGLDVHAETIPVAIAEPDGEHFRFTCCDLLIL